jgi:DNA-binding response OmpR family regulator
MEKIKILVAEDEVTSQKIYERGLDDEVFDCHFVANGTDAIHAYLEEQPELIVLDMRMPGMTGYAVLKEIRKTHEDQNVAVVMATAVSDKDDVVACVQLGIQGYIVKPIKIGEIGAKVLECYQKTNPEKAAAGLKSLEEKRKKHFEEKMAKARASAASSPTETNKE